MDSGQIILFQTQGGETKIEVRLANESVWLTSRPDGGTVSARPFDHKASFKKRITGEEIK